MTSMPFDPHDQEIWRGGYYEAAMVLGPSTASDAGVKLRSAIEALWGDSALTIAAFGDIAEWKWQDVAISADTPFDGLHRIYGVLRHETLGTVPFTSVVVREEDGADWLYACVPLGGLPQSDGYPFGDDDELGASQGWREPLEKALADLTMKVAENAGIQIAAIGFEIAGIIDAEAALKATRYAGYITRQDGVFRYWPTNAWGAKA